VGNGPPACGIPIQPHTGQWTTSLHFSREIKAPNTRMQSNIAIAPTAFRPKPGPPSYRQQGHYCYCSCLNSLVGLRTPLSRPSERQKVGSAYLSRCSDFAPENFSGYFLAASMATPATRDREHLRSHHGWRLPKLPGVPERELRSCGRAASAASSRRFRQCLHRSSPTTRCWNASRTFRCALTRGNGALPNAFQEAVAMS